MSPARPKLTSLDERLHSAAFHGNLRAIASALADGADAKSIGRRGHTALIWVCDLGALECARLLLPLSDPLAVDDDRETALILAAGSGNDELAVLLAPVSEVCARNSWGQSAADLARENKLARALPLIEALAQARELGSALPGAEPAPARAGSKRL